MPRRALVLLALPLVLAGCGLSRTAATTGQTTAPEPPATTSTQVVEQSTPLTVYFLRDGKVAPVNVEVPRTQAVAGAALEALAAGPPEGYDTALPAGTTFADLRIADGVATVAPSPGLDHAAQAQVVYTLTQFPSVQGVGLGTGEPLTRADFEDVTPRILVESPLPGTTVASPLHASGTSNDTEATFQLELVQDGKVLASTHVTATSGNGVRGTFDQELAFTGSGPATLVAYERNVGEGPPQLGRVEIPVTLGS